MKLDERLRRLAHDVPAPPRADGAALYRRGLRRRRWRHAAQATAALAVVGILGVGIASLVDRPAQIDVAEQPDERADRPPVLTLSSSEPFPWTVSVFATDGDRWCASPARGTTQIDNLPCDQSLALPDEDEITWHESELDRATGTTTQTLSFGLAPADTETVVVEFTDGSRREASIARTDGMDVVLWAIGYLDVDVDTITASGDDWTSGTTVLDGFDALDLLRVLGLLAVLAAAIAATRWLARRRRRGNSAS